MNWQNPSGGMRGEALEFVLKSKSIQDGALDRSRTCDLPIRNRLLYPTELPVRISLNFKKSIDSKGFNGSDL